MTMAGKPWYSGEGYITTSYNYKNGVVAITYFGWSQSLYTTCSVSGFIAYI